MSKYTVSTKTLDLLTVPWDFSVHYAPTYIHFEETYIVLTIFPLSLTSSEKF